MNKLLKKIVGAAVGLTMAIGVGFAVGNKHDISATDAAIDADTGCDFTGSNSVNGKTAIKVGTGKAGGTASFTVVTGSTKLKIYVAAWNGESPTITVGPSGKISPTSVSPSSDSGISGGSSSYTLSGNESSFLETFTLSSITTDTTISFAVSGGNKRFAIWSPTVKETISYNANGATSGTAPSSHKGLMGTDVTTSTNSGSLAKTNFSFTGWNTRADGTGIHVDAGDDYSLGTDAVTLYAEWTPNGTAYTVTDLVGYGSLSSTSSILEDDPLDITISHETHYHLPSDFTVTMEDENENPVTLTKGTDYTYNSSTGALHIEHVTGNVVISGDCEPDPTYTITYTHNSNGEHEGDEYSVSGLYSGDSHTLVSLATAGISAKTGYIFSHYTVGDDELQPGEAFDITGNTTVTAVFVQKPNKARYAQTAYNAASLDTASNVDVEPTTIEVGFANDNTSNKEQMTAGEDQVWTLTGYSGYAIRSIVVSVRNNKSSGSGTAAFKYDGKTISNSETLSGLGNESYSRKTVFSGMQPISGDKAFTVELNATANSLFCEYIEVEWSEIPTLLNVSVSGTPSKATQYTGNDFVYTGLVFTANYSDSSSLTISGKDIAWNELAAGNNPTGTYGGKTVTVTSVTVLDDSVDHLSASVSKDYLVGETITKSDIVLKQVWVSEKETTVDSGDYTFADYSFLYSDAPTGGSTKDNKVFAISFGGKSCNLTVKVSRTSFTAATGVSNVYSTFPTGSGNLAGSYTTNQNVTIGGTAFNVDGYVYNSKLSLSESKTSAPGQIHNTAAYAKPIGTVSVSGATPDVQVSKNGTNWVDYSTSTTASGNYYYVKLYYKNTTQTNYVNITSFTVALKGDETARTLADYVMYENTTNQCVSKFSVAEAIFETLSKSEKSSFMTGESHIISSAKARLVDWAAHEGKTIELVDGEYTIRSANNSVFSIFDNKQDSTITLITIVSLISLTAIGGFLLIKRRKEQQ